MAHRPSKLVLQDSVDGFVLRRNPWGGTHNVMAMEGTGIESFPDEVHHPGSLVNDIMP